VVDQLDQADTLLFGRLTYQMMAGYWPTPAAHKDHPRVTARMNSTSKIVVSRTLDKYRVGQPLIEGDAAEDLATRLKLLTTRAFSSGNVLLTYQPRP
jgi:hypothetical protein